MDGPLENARMAVMKWIVPVRHPCILNVTINTVFHPGDNVMVSMIVMICRMKIIVLVVLVSMDDFWILCSVWPKPGFGIGNRNQSPISVSEPKFFFPKPKLSVSNFSHVSHFFLGDMSFYKLENKPRSSKIIWKYLKFGSKFGFKGPFVMGN